eukprot:GHVQ01003627.1.p1 GENE.GHVQ01003627.1~~GHVQ01003627.1.p1  ORF type:complete len:343 (-),score=53.73 GHVQ01003627.1:146-1174(-)
MYCVFYVCECIVCSMFVNVLGTFLYCSLQATQSMCAWCFDTLIYHLADRGDLTGGLNPPPLLSADSHPPSASSFSHSSHTEHTNPLHPPTNSNTHTQTRTHHHNLHTHQSPPPPAPYSHMHSSYDDPMLLRSHHWHSRSPPDPPRDVVRLRDEGVECPMFVTWTKHSGAYGGRRGWSGEGELRGCVGCLTPTPIADICGYALKSGVKDRRFNPLVLKDVPLLSCKLSLLHSFEPCEHLYEWEVGVHGVTISFVVDGGQQYSATFLPEVAVEHDMSQRTVITELVRKSHYTGPITDELLNSISVTRYQSSRTSLSYENYVTHHCKGRSSPHHHHNNARASIFR